MLPATAKFRQRGNIWLTFRGKMIQRGPVSFHSDSMTYNF
jgi:hypothetical protein